MNRLLITLAGLLVAAAVSAQSLVEVARKEKERRKKLQPSEGRSYTEFDLRGGRGPMTQVTGGGPGAATSEDESSVEADSGESAQPDPAQTRDYWQNRLSTLDEKIRELETKLQSPLFTVNPRGARERQTLERELEEARAARVALMNEARRAGVPPGWLR